MKRISSEWPTAFLGMNRTSVALRPCPQPTMITSIKEATVEEDRKKTNPILTEGHDKISGNGHREVPRVAKQRKPSFRELKEHPDMEIDRRRLRLTIKAADIGMFLAEECDGGKQIDQIG